MTDTIFALSSGLPPAAIGVIRISGPQACHALQKLVGSLPEPRHAVLRSLRKADGVILDRALILWFDGPHTATGEDLAEIHCHGGRAVVAVIEHALGSMPMLRKAQPGEFTRRAFANGIVDLAEAEGLADLLSAETELQRRAAQAAMGGGLSRRVEGWRDQVLALSAQVEAALDFSDEDDVDALPPEFSDTVVDLAIELRAALDAPRSERLRDGIRVVFAGPPNAGKSSLFNAILDEGAAIVSAEAGTTRDVIERPVALGGIAFILIDTAGIRESGAGVIEAMGVDRAKRELERADIILWLGPEGEGPAGAIEIASKIDIHVEEKEAPDYRVSSTTMEGVAELTSGLVQRANGLVPRPGEVALNRRQADALAEASEALEALPREADMLICGENLRIARRAFDRLLGRQSTEEVLDALFGRFCIGK